MILISTCRHKVRTPHMAYVIASPRLGTVGDTYEPSDGINVEALVEGGFIKSTSKSTKSDKPIKDTNEEN